MKKIDFGPRAVKIPKPMLLAMVQYYLFGREVIINELEVITEILEILRGLASSMF